MQTDDLEIKRQMGAAGDMIRVMSVHGSKGLEAPIVILPDTAKRKPPSDAEIIVAEGAPLWRVPKDQMPAAMLTAREAAQEKQQNERLRLLYVALTRAEKWLIVASAGELSKEGDSWYQMVERALNDGGAAETDLPGGLGLRLQHGDWDGLEFVAHDAPEPKKVILPQVFTQPAPAYVAPEPTLSPSDLSGAKALPGDQGLDEEAAKARGTNLHLLLEHLPTQPEDRWPDLARALLAGCEDQGELLEEASAVLRNPDLAHVFAPGTLSEMAVTADLDGIRLHGVIDRLIVESDRVLAVDFKSNATVPQSVSECPDGLLRQMGAYALALGRIYPGKTIETALIWTRNATLMPLPHEVVTRAFQRHGEP
jgi:ATP-dependent helicase/nuclease subunit A